YYDIHWYQNGGKVKSVMVPRSNLLIITGSIMSSQATNTEKVSPPVDYVANQGGPDDEAKAQKFILTDSLSEDIGWLSEAENLSKTDIVKRALHHYFSRSQHWNNKRYFLEKASGSKVDISKATTHTEVNVRWCNEKTDPVSKSIFVACHILDIDGDDVLINPFYYPSVSMSDDAALIQKSEAIVPGFIDFDPYNLLNPYNFYNPPKPPYLNQLTYKINSKYLWPITPISNDL
ncbi:hypothetical protein, partial [Psychrobacter sp. JCM 18903]|uniref:hypothetical protein n=2 Tax=Psychrobacter sp. JCM 18903 TaxID=1298610 RepID=UPI001A9D7374